MTYVGNLQNLHAGRDAHCLTHGLNMEDPYGPRNWPRAQRSRGCNHRISSKSVDQWYIASRQRSPATLDFIVTSRPDLFLISASRMTLALVEHRDEQHGIPFATCGKNESTMPGQLRKSDPVEVHLANSHNQSIRLGNKCSPLSRIPCIVKKAETQCH